MSPMWQRSDKSTCVTSQPQLDLKTLPTIVSQDYGSYDFECESEGSDREAIRFTSNPEPDGEGHPSDPVYLKPRACIAIRKYSFPKENPSFNLYAPFCNRINYQLA